MKSGQSLMLLACLGLLALSACDSTTQRSPIYRELAGRWVTHTASGQREVLVLGADATFRLERAGRRVAEGELGFSGYDSESLAGLRSLSYTISFSRSYSEGTSDSVVAATPSVLRLKGCIVLRECRGEEPGRVYLTERTYLREGVAGR